PAGRAGSPNVQTRNRNGSTMCVMGFETQPSHGSADQNAADSSPTMAASLSRRLLRDDGNAIGPQRQRDRPVERRASTRVRLVDDPLAIVDLDPVAQGVGEERAPDDRALEWDATSDRSLRSERK